jgi:predicted transcriptional regulator
MDNCILLSIRKNWAAAILSGEKRLEIRKCAPSYNPNTEKTRRISPARCNV